MPAIAAYDVYLLHNFWNITRPNVDHVPMWLTLTYRKLNCIEFGSETSIQSWPIRYIKWVCFFTSSAFSFFSFSVRFPLKQNKFSRYMWFKWTATYPRYFSLFEVLIGTNDAKYVGQMKTKLNSDYHGRWPHML